MKTRGHIRFPSGILDEIGGCGLRGRIRTVRVAVGQRTSVGGLLGRVDVGRLEARGALRLIRRPLRRDDKPRSQLAPNQESLANSRVNLCRFPLARTCCRDIPQSRRGLPRVWSSLRPVTPTTATLTRSERSARGYLHPESRSTEPSGRLVRRGQGPGRSNSSHRSRHVQRYLCAAAHLRFCRPPGLVLTACAGPVACSPLDPTVRVQQPVPSKWLSCLRKKLWLRACNRRFSAIALASRSFRSVPTAVTFAQRGQFCFQFLHTLLKLLDNRSDLTF